MGGILLKSVRIQRFKSVSDATIELGGVTLLVGPNNAGKSSVLQAIQFGVSIAQSLKLDGNVRWIQGKTWSGTLSTQQLVYTPLRDVHALAAGGSLQQAGNEIVVSYETDDLGDAEVIVRRGKNKNISVNITGKTLAERLQDLDQPFSVVAPGLAGIPSVEEYKARGVVTRAAARGDANSVFRNVLLTLKSDPTAWAEFESSLAEVFDDIVVEVDFNEKTDEYIDARVRKGDVLLPIDSSGTGVLQTIQVLAYIGVYKPDLLILDEPDSHLHPDNQRKMATLLAAMVERGDLQVLISTHSRHFLDAFGALGARICWFSAGQPQEGDFDRVRALLDLGALDASDRLRNGQTPYVFITEDSDDKYLRAVVEASGLASTEYDIWDYAGSSSVAAGRILARFIKENAPATTVVVHRDRDYLTDVEVEAYRTEIEDSGAQVLLTEGTDIESFFLRAPHLEAIFPELSDEQRTALIEDATAETRDKSLEVMINARTEKALYEKRQGRSADSTGKIAVATPVDFDANPERYRHGKKTLGVVLRLAQERHGLNRNPAVTSSALKVDELAASVEAMRQGQS